jgi:hypothetical protein
MTQPAADTSPANAKPSRAGVWIVAGVLLLAVLMAGGNFLYQYFSTRDALEFWGHDAAELFRSESTMTVALLAPADAIPEASDTETASQAFNIGGVDYLSGEQNDATSAGGNLHFRRALLQRRLYDWTTSPRPVPDDASIVWRYAVTFDDDNDQITLVFSDDANHVAMAMPSGAILTPSRTFVQPDKMLNLAPNEEGVSPVKAFLDEQFTAAGSGNAREF